MFLGDNLKFRSDINTLRALAVIAVLVYHFNPSLIPGGFAGVDVFFVISGFLMTAIILTGLEENNFSFNEFYLSRVERIIPPLGFLCLFLIVIGWFTLTPLDYQILNKHIASSLSFVSNFIYLSESGYFDISSNEKWLLHTWSLSVEWQFYIIYPIVLTLLYKKISFKNLKITILSITIISFIISAIATNIWPNASYFLLPTRAWEMLVGGLAYLYPFQIRKRLNRVISPLSITIIITSFFIFTENDLWPGYLSIIPVIGAFLFIQASNQRSLLINNAIIQRVGTASYSIYLWHWPIVVAFSKFSPETHYLWGIALSIMSGFLSYYFIEKKRVPNKIKNNVFKKYWALITCSPILILSCVFFFSKIVQSHYSDEYLTIASEKGNKNPRRSECHVGSGSSPRCQYGEGRPAAIVLGDSHAQSIVRTIEKIYAPIGSTIDWTMSSCLPVQGISLLIERVWDSSCSEHIKESMLLAKTTYSGLPIFINNRTASYIHGPNELSRVDEINLESVRTPHSSSYDFRSLDWQRSVLSEFESTLCELSESNPIYLLTDNPEFKESVPKAMLKAFIDKGTVSRIFIEKSEHLERTKMVRGSFIKLEEKCNVNIIDLDKALCSENGKCYADIDGRPMYYDDDHLSEFGANSLIPLIKKITNL